MAVNLENLAAVHTHTHTHTHGIYLEDRIFASFLCLKINLILSKIINRVDFTYVFRLRECNLSI